MVNTEFAGKMKAIAEFYDDMVYRYRNTVEDAEKKYREFATAEEGSSRDYSYSAYLEDLGLIEILHNVIKMINPESTDFVHPSWMVAESIVDKVSQE